MKRYQYKEGDLIRITTSEAGEKFYHNIAIVTRVTINIANVQYIYAKIISGKLKGRTDIWWSNEIELIDHKVKDLSLI